MVLQAQEEASRTLGIGVTSLQQKHKENKLNSNSRPIAHSISLPTSHHGNSQSSPIFTHQPRGILVQPPLRKWGTATRSHRQEGPHSRCTRLVSTALLLLLLLRLLLMTSLLLSHAHPHLLPLTVVLEGWRDFADEIHSMLPQSAPTPPPSTGVHT